MSDEFTVPLCRVHHLELIEDDRSGTYRAVYTVRFETAIYVLHVFQKKSKHGKATPQRDMELVETRLARAAAMHAGAIKGKEPKR